jgi:hypothetical protein
MVSAPKPFNPLDYDNLTANCVNELLKRGPEPLPLKHEFQGSGVYALFYLGDLPVYATVRSPDAARPIYVGKPIPVGGRKGLQIGTTVGRSLHNRLSEHTTSIQSAVNLRIEDFLCRYLVVEPLWIVMAERFLIQHHQPLWNVCLDGFGNHDPGRGRHQGEITWWDALHPGRAWAARLRQIRTVAAAAARVEMFLQASKDRREEITLSALEAGEAES